MVPYTDRTLPHQPIIENSSNPGHPTLNCNCRWRVGLEPIGVCIELPDTVRMYNDPDNHIEPFGEEEMLNGQRRQGI